MKLFWILILVSALWNQFVSFIQERIFIFYDVQFFAAWPLIILHSMLGTPPASSFIFRTSLERSAIYRCWLKWNVNFGAVTPAHIFRNWNLIDLKWWQLRIERFLTGIDCLKDSLFCFYNCMFVEWFWMSQLF